MTFDNIELYCQVLGSVMKEPVLLHNTPNPITINDFSKNNVIARTIFFAVNNIANNESRFISNDMIIAYLNQYDNLKSNYNRYNGSEFVQMCLDKGSPENFNIFYNQLKKTSLLVELKSRGFNIIPYDFEAAAERYGGGSRKELECIERYENATEEEILGYVERQFEELRTNYISGGIGGGDISDGIDELLENLGDKGDYGLPIRGEMFNSIVRGARLGCMYLRSAGTNAGKTRNSVFDACEGVYPIIYDLKKNCFTYNKSIIPVKTLFIATEQTSNEIKMMVLAYISGIEESRIRANIITPGERERLRIAAKIMKHFDGYFKWEEINDPNLTNVQNVIKKHVIQNGIKYIYYDYIFSSPSLVSDMKGLREDVTLMLLSNQLKEIAKTYNIFIMSSTQLNGEGLVSGRKRDQSMIRGSKAIADKADIGCIIAPVDEAEMEQVKTIVDKIGLAPTHVIDVYKIRSGRFRGVRIWTRINLGNGRQEDLFITDSDNNYLTFDAGERIDSLRKFSEAVPIEGIDNFIDSIPVDAEIIDVGKDNDF